MSYTIPHKEKLNGESYSVGISKHIPESGVNLAYVASPEITEKNISVLNEPIGFGLTESYGEKENLHYVKDQTGFVTDVRGRDLLITDEFSIKKYTDEMPEPLFYKARLKKKMKGSSFLTGGGFVPYQYGYTNKTEDGIRADNTSDDKTDIMPLIYKETYETGYNNLLSIVSDSGEKIISGFKIRMIRQDNDEYTADIYNNFDRREVYRVTYINSQGEVTTEVLESELLFSMITYEEFETRIGDEEYMAAKEYAVKQEEKGYRLYAPAEIMKITDDVRKPFEFKYRVFGNVKTRYGKSNPARIKAGLLYLDQNVSEDMHSLLVAFNQTIGRMFPEYVSFENPHPPSTYAGASEEAKNSQSYWDVDLTASQDHINDYDIIFMTGYGTHDLSVFNAKLAAYLKSGGKLVIDNLSNETTSLLNISFGSSDPIVSYSVFGSGLTEAKEYGSETEYSDRHYKLSTEDPSQMAYMEDMQVGPALSVDDENPENITDIIRYSSGMRSVLIKTYMGRGKIVISNCGILKAFCFGENEAAKRFTVNMTLVLAEDMWGVTPWIYDRVLHKNQLYKHEYSLEGYITDISPVPGENKIVAKKIIADSVGDFFSYYSGLRGLNGKYYIEAFERNAQNALVSLSSVYMPSVLDSKSRLYAFARGTSNTAFNVTSVSSYEESNIHPYPAVVRFKATITPFTFKWVNEGGRIVQKLVEPEVKNRVKIPFEITKSEGLVNLGLLSSMIPELPGGPDWADKSKIFFKVEISADEEDGRFVNDSENRINLHIYDKFSGEYIYTSDSNNIIYHDTLFGWRDVAKYDGRIVSKQRYHDIILQASANHYELIASRRAYAVINGDNNRNLISFPSGLNTNESWFPLLKYLRFTKNSFSKEDYDRISKTLGFKYDKEYILEKANEYFGEAPSDDKVAQVIALLGGDETVDAEDLAILAEAFDMVDESVSYEYDMTEYFDQVWHESFPYRSIKDERAKYAGTSSVKVQHTPLHISTGHSEGESLQRISSTVYRSLNANWIESAGIMIQVESQIQGVWEPATGVRIDTANGTLVFDTPPLGAVRASYDYSNLKVMRNTYVNTKAGQEPLVKLRDGIYMPEGMANKIILKNPNPIVTVRYTDGTVKTLKAGSYSIDYDTGIVRLSETETGDVYMSYSYAGVEHLGIKDYDSRHGILELDRNIHFNDNIRVSYVYEEDSYEYKGYYDENAKKFMYVDLNPTRGHECTYPAVIDDRVEFKEIPTYKLLGKTLYIYMLPHKTIVNGQTKEERITIRHTFDKNELSLIQLAHPEAIVLGSIKLVNSYSMYDVATLDTRKRGGGLKESISKEQIEKRDELSLNLWDISPFDGRTYHPNGLAIIMLPESVLSTSGGRFTRDEILEITEAHLAYGVMPIVKYYNE